MQNLKNLIFGLLEDDSKTLVFTSEIVARSWLRKYAVESGLKTVFLDRAISWDKYKTTLVNSGNLRQITSVERQIFAYEYLKNNFERLTYFSSKYRESIRPFASAVAGYLPFFAYADESSAEALCDIKLIVDSYRKYLEENNLCEYNFLPKNYSCVNKNQVLIFPETFNDPIVDDISGLCTVVSTKEVNNKNMKITSYKNSICEIRSVLRDIATRLDEGEDPNEIAITCACTDQYRFYLADEAKKLDIDLCFTTSLPVSSSAQGRFFEVIRTIFEKEYSFESMKKFLLDPGFPFKDPEANRKLLQSAIRFRLKKSPEEEWIRRLQKDENLNYFTALSKAIDSIFKTEDKALVIEAVRNFTKEFFDEKSFFFEQNSVFEKCMSLLDLTGNYNLFLQVLQNETYVDSAKNGIRVYKYPVSAASAVKFNYVIGLDDRNTSISFDKFPYLPMYKKDLEELDSTVKTDDVLAVYANADSDSKVFLSGTKDGFEGTRLLPMSLVEEKNNSKLNDVYENEKALWLGNLQNAKFSKAQKTGFEEAGKGILNYSDKFVIPESEKLQNIDISASAFKDYSKCPFKGFVSIYLKPNQLDLEPNAMDPRVVGNILHHTIQTALEEVKDYSKIKSDQIERILKNEIQKAARNYELGPKVYQDYLEQKYSKILPEISKAGFVDPLSGSTLFGNEINFEIKHKVDGLDNVFLKGRIDTVMQNYDGYIVVDYKTTNNTKDHSSDLKEANPQVAIYAQILRDNIEGAEVVAGAYYTIADHKMRFVWPQKNKNVNIEYDSVDFDLHEKETKLRTSILNSEFIPEVEEDNCKSCPYGGICRGRFVVR